MDTNIVFFAGIIAIAAGVAGFALAAKGSGMVKVGATADQISSERYMRTVLTVGGFLTFIPGIFLMVFAFGNILTGRTF